MNKNNNLLWEVSASGDCVAFCTPDGFIKFYDTITGNLKSEFASTIHLNATCSCLAWPQFKQRGLSSSSSSNESSNSKSQSKKVKQINVNLNDLDLIAIGTNEGSILLYSLSKGALHSVLSEGGHIDKVNDICWSQANTNSLFSCSDDGHIIEWSINESKVISKWKASKRYISALTVDSSSKYLVCSSKNISVWDLETKKLLKTLTGHSNDILKLSFINEKNSSSSKIFTSFAANDRIINAWRISEESLADDSSNQTAVASFSLADDFAYADILSLNESKKQDLSASSLGKLFMCCVTHKGKLYMYNQQINETEAKSKSTTNGKKLKKPSKHSNELQIENKDGGLLKIYCAFLLDSNNERVTQLNNGDLSKLQICLVYGSHLAPTIEKHTLSEFLEQSKIVLKRSNSLNMNVSLQTHMTKIEVPVVNKDVKVLGSSYMTPLTSNNLTSSNSKRKFTEPSQIPLEDRLNTLGVESLSVSGKDYIEWQNDSVGTTPTVDNLMVVLIQGLQSNDAKMLNHVFQHKNEKIVAKTVRVLPSHYIIPLVKELNRRLQGHAQSGINVIKWLKCVLMIHTSFLMSYPDLIESLGSVYEMMNARTKLFPQLSKLQGKLQLVMSQISSQAHLLNAGNTKDSQPLLYYHDSTSEDEQIEDELIPSHSEFDEYLFSDEEEANENDDDDDDDADADDDDNDDDDDEENENDDGNDEEGSDENDDDDE